MSNPLRIGCVSYLNARPLIDGLERDPSLSLHLEVPSRLLAGLRDHRFDVALLPVIDYQRLSNLVLLPVGGIASDGPTLTVRIFSRVPIAEIRELACDSDSHTSVALARILLAHQFDLHPELSELNAAGGSRAESILLIGDKVVCEQPAGYPHQLDLGESWKQMTTLPFVFAAWFARDDIDLADLPTKLQDAKKRGADHIDQIITQYALPRGWREETARRYLTSHLKYDIGERELEAIRLFHRYAAGQELIPAPPRPLVIHGSPSGPT